MASAVVKGLTTDQARLHVTTMVLTITVFKLSAFHFLYMLFTIYKCIYNYIQFIFHDPF